MNHECKSLDDLKIDVFLDDIKVDVLKAIRKLIKNDCEQFDNYIAEREAWKRGGVGGK